LLLFPQLLWALLLMLLDIDIAVRKKGISFHPCFHLLLSAAISLLLLIIGGRDGDGGGWIMDYLKTLSVSKQYSVRLRNDELERIWMEAVVTYPKVPCRYLPGKLRQTIINSVRNFVVSAVEIRTHNLQNKCLERDT
jgi:hypothetical protein